MWVHQSKHLKLSLPRRIIIFILGFFDNLLFGGAIFGWPQLVYLLKVDNIYANLCDDDEPLSQITNSTTDHSDGKIIMGMDFSNITRCLEINNSSVNINTSHVQHQQCVAQDERFALVYTVALICYGIPGVVVGYLLHHAGLRITRMLGGMMVSVSFICLALTTAESPNWLFPATILLSMGGNQIRMSGMQFGDLFPKYGSTTITVLTGVYAASASLFILFSIAQENNISRILVCYIIGGVALVSTLLSVLMPPHHIPHEGEHLEEDEIENIKQKQNKTEICDASLWDSFKTLSSILHLYWFFVLLFCINIYQQFYNVWITASTCNEEEAGFYSKLFSYSMIASVFCAPIGGLYTDYLIKKAKKDSNDNVQFLVKKIQANFLSLFITTVFSLIMPICMLFFAPTAVIISLLALIIVRPCVVAISTAYIRIRFPADHFNRLLGYYCTIASILMYFQYPLFLWAQHSYYQALTLVILLNVFTLLNPLHLLCTSHIRKGILLQDKSNDEDARQELTENLKQ